LLSGLKQLSAQPTRMSDFTDEQFELAVDPHWLQSTTTVEQRREFPLTRVQVHQVESPPFGQAALVLGTRAGSKLLEYFWIIDEIFGWSRGQHIRTCELAKEVEFRIFLQPYSPLHSLVVSKPILVK
jgi:hypothetical protein